MAPWRTGPRGPCPRSWASSLATPGPRTSRTPRSASACCGEAMGGDQRWWRWCSLPSTLEACLRHHSTDHSTDHSTYLHHFFAWIWHLAIINDLSSSSILSRRRPSVNINQPQPSATISRFMWATTIDRRPSPAIHHQPTIIVQVDVRCKQTF